MDSVIPSGLSRELASALPDSRYISFKTGGHGLLYQYPKELAHVVVSHLLEQKSYRKRCSSTVDI